MAAQGPENTIEVKVIISKCGPDTSGADYTRLLPYVLFSGHTVLISGPKTYSLDLQPPFLTKCTEFQPFSGQK